MGELLDRFRRLARDRPSRTLIVARSEGRVLTAGRIRDESLAVRDALAAGGLGPGAVLLSLAGNRATFAAVVLACLDRQVTLMPVDRDTPATEVAALATAYGAGALVVPEGLAVPLPHAAIPLPGGLALGVLRDQPPRGRYPDTVLLKLTSGSAGVPRAARAAERHLAADGHHITAAMDIRPDDVQLGVIPLSHMYGFGNLLLPLLLQGTPMVLREAFAPAQVIADLTAHAVRIWPGVPFMFDAIADQAAPGARPPHLAICISAGARLEAATVRTFHRRFGRKIHSFYGATETGGITYDDSAGLADPVPVGRPIGDVAVALRPVAEADLAPGVGRVHVRSAAVSDGYAEAAAGAGDAGAAGSGAFVDGGYLTGDLGAFDPAGRLVLAGRVSSFVNVAGRKVQPEEIERLLRTMPGVADASVLATTDPRRGQALAACLVRTDPGLRPIAVRTFLASRVAPHKIPRAVVFVDELPRTGRGKVDRRAIEALVRRSRP